MRFTPRHARTAPIAEALTRIERARRFLETATLSDEWIRRTRDRALVLEAHHTTHIEGTRLTLEDSARLLAGEALPGADPEDARELLNYPRALAVVSESLDDGWPITESLVREIHRRLVEGVRGDAAAPGEYRRVQNYVVDSATGDIVYTPPSAHDVPNLMCRLVAWLNEPGDVHPVLVSGIAQFQLAHIHPFIDGNGRTSRLLSMLVLYRAGYACERLFTISELYDGDRPAFYQAIRSVRAHEMDLTGWLEYYTDGLARQLDEVTARAERDVRRR